MRACLSEKERYAILIAQEQEEQKKATRRGRWTRLGVASLACAVSFIPNVAPEVADSIRFYLVLVAYVVLEDPLFTRFVDLISFGRK